MKNILITGAFGYIGGRLSKYLAENTEFYLILSSSVSRKKPSWLKHGEVIQYSLDDDNNLFDRIHSRVDTVIHLASINEVECSKNPELAVRLNTLGSFKLIQNAIKEKIGNFIYLSTAHVYGAPLVGDISEQKLTRPTHPYAYSHRAVEDYIAEANDKSNMAAICVRLSNSLGAPVDKSVNRWMLLVSDLCVEAINKKSLTLKSSGIQKRDFIGLNDVVRGVEHLTNLSKEKIGDGIFNLGGNYSSTILDMATLIQSRCKVVLDIDVELFVPARKESEVDSELNFMIDKIESTGFKLDNCIETEIDDLLIFCSKYMVN